MAAFANWLLATLKTLLVHLYNVFVDLVNAFILGVSTFAASLASMLPEYTIPSPGQMIDQVGFLSALNWVLPVSFFVNCLTMMAFAYATYTVVAPVLRWFKILR